MYEYLPGRHYLESSVNHYYIIVRQWFTSDAEVETIYELVQRKLDKLNAIENPTSVDHNQIHANQCFCQFYKEWQGTPDADTDATVP